MGSLIHRLIHQLVFSWHRGWLFVDDFLWQLVQSTAPLQATLVCCFLAAINCPMSWHKLQFNIEVKRIGWIWNISFKCRTLPDDKTARILHFLMTVVKSANNRMDRGVFENSTGLLL